MDCESVIGKVFSTGSGQTAVITMSNHGDTCSSVPLRFDSSEESVCRKCRIEISAAQRKEGCRTRQAKCYVTDCGTSAAAESGPRGDSLLCVYRPRVQEPMASSYLPAGSEPSSTSPSLS